MDHLIKFLMTSYSQEFACLILLIIEATRNVIEQVCIWHHALVQAVTIIINKLHQLPVIIKVTA